MPRYSDEIHEAKRGRRRAERRWRSTGTADDLDAFAKRSEISFSCSEFIDQIADHQGKLFRAVNDLLVDKDTLCFSDFADESALASDLGRYFVQKVIRLRDELDQCAVPDDSVTNSDSPTPVFIETFAPLTKDDVCELNLHLAVSCIEPLIPVITKIIYISLDSGIFPVSWKEAVLFIPLLKKSGLDSVFLKELAPREQFGLHHLAYRACCI